jgi:hypothetical protein
MEGRAAAAAAAHKRAKRATGHLRAAARLLAPEAAELDVVAELELRRTNPTALEGLVELLELELSRRPELTVVIVARPRLGDPQP